MKSKLKRDKSRFYNYPPVLSGINGKEIFERKKTALYFHIPFCAKLCYFCPYTKYFSSREVIEKYLDALKKEINLISVQPAVQNIIVSSIFFGGGTPSFLSGNELSDILFLCRKSFVLSDGCQITAEANPLSVDKKKLRKLVKSGFNRISFGVQSFDDKFLSKLGTSHNSGQAVKAINLAKNNGFKNINIDLMYRLPDQKLENWKKDLQTALGLNITHITTYALNIVPGTALFAMQKTDELNEIPSFEEEKKMMLLADELLGKKGFKRYLIDQFSLKGKENRYAIQTLSGEVIGFGCGAVSHFNGFEYRNYSDLHSYIKEVNKSNFGIEKGKKLTKKEEMERYMIKQFLSLKIDLIDFKEKFGVEFKKVFSEQLNELKKHKLISINKNKIKVSVKGRMYIYNICKQFFSKEYKEIINRFEQLQEKN